MMDKLHQYGEKLLECSVLLYFKFVALRVTMSLEALTTEALAAIAAAQDLLHLIRCVCNLQGKKPACRTIESIRENGP